MSRHGVLVAGVGNIFLSDDGFGCEVARRLEGAGLPAGVRVADYGIGGIHLAYDLLDEYALLILLDTVDDVGDGGRPGDVAVIEVDPDDGRPQLDAHSMDPATVFTSLRTLGGSPPRTLLVGCKPADVGEGMGLSPAVADAVDVAIAAVRELLGNVADGASTPAAAAKEH
ncbi:MAG: hydrogenase maturation protease [Egibacteraceae bacterium]